MDNKKPSQFFVPSLPNAEPTGDVGGVGVGEDDDVLVLIAEARAVSRHAYCPYSRFAVGAAVLWESGATTAGCNVENASYGLTLCAERAAIVQRIARGGLYHDRISKIVVHTPTPHPTAPCGACRQVISEFGPDAEVIAVCDGPDRLRTTIRTLLPGAFGPQDLR